MKKLLVSFIVLSLAISSVFSVDYSNYSKEELLTMLTEIRAELKKREESQTLIDKVPMFETDDLQFYFAGNQRIEKRYDENYYCFDLLIVNNSKILDWVINEYSPSVSINGYEGLALSVNTYKLKHGENTVTLRINIDSIGLNTISEISDLEIKNLKLYRDSTWESQFRFDFKIFQEKGIPYIQWQLKI